MYQSTLFSLTNKEKLFKASNFSLLKITVALTVQENINKRNTYYWSRIFCEGPNYMQR